MFTTMLIESDMKRYLKLQGKKAGPPEKEQHYPWSPNFRRVDVPRLLLLLSSSWDIFKFTRFVFITLKKFTVFFSMEIPVL